jgi:hypothetical protein
MHKLMSGRSLAHGKQYRTICVSKKGHQKKYACVFGVLFCKIFRLPLRKPNLNHPFPMMKRALCQSAYNTWSPFLYKHKWIGFPVLVEELGKNDAITR